MPDGFEGGFGGRHRNRQQHNIGAGNGQQGGGRFHVNDAHLARAFGGGWGFAVANDAFDQASAFERQRKRAAHQAAPNET